MLEYIRTGLFIACGYFQRMNIVLHPVGRAKHEHGSHGKQQHNEIGIIKFEITPTAMGFSNFSFLSSD